MSSLRDSFNPPEGGYKVLEPGDSDITPAAINGVKITGGLHRLAIRPFIRVVAALGVPLRAGSQFGYEHKRKSGSSGTGTSGNWSVHATGFALDVNASDNWHDGTPGSPYRLPANVDDRLELLGFKSGANWSDPDRMHIQPRVDLSTLLDIHKRLDGINGGNDKPPVFHYGAWYHGARAGRRQLDLGDAGDDVKDLQARLNVVASSNRINVDGYFGPGTEAKVKAYQKRAKLTVDGIAGRRTLGALGFNVQF